MGPVTMMWRANQFFNYTHRIAGSLSAVALFAVDAALPSLWLADALVLFALIAGCACWARRVILLLGRQRRYSLWWRVAQHKQVLQSSDSHRLRLEQFRGGLHGLYCLHRHRDWVGGFCGLWNPFGVGRHISDFRRDVDLWLFIGCQGSANWHLCIYSV